MISLRVPIAVSIVLVGVAVCAGCASRPVPGTTSSVEPTSTSTSGASAEADALLAAAVVPPGARMSSALPAKVLAEPAQRPACTPLIDVTGYWLAPNTTLDETVAYLKAHPTRSLHYQGEGHMTSSGRTVTADVVEAKPGATRVTTTLVYTLAQAADGAIGVRVDAQVIPPGSACMSSGGGEDQ